jgi:hypothetical protein
MFELTNFSSIFLVVNAGLILLLPRHLVLMPLLIGTCYMTMGQGLKLGPLHFPIIRLLLGVAFLRVVFRRERLEHGFNSLDWLMIAWSVWAMCSSIFYIDTSEVLVSRLGLVYNTCGFYFMVRFFCQSQAESEAVLQMTAILLVPVAFFMFLEAMTGYNVFSSLGGVPELSAIREGRIRAQGPFAHPILAGTVGAVCIPLMVGLWRQYPKTALIGLTACMTMIFSCASSGPILSLIGGIVALLMWRFRDRMRFVRWLGILMYIGLDIVMQAPAYYLIARVDVVGGSTGYHRAMLIESAFQHLSEWWLAGTNYTRHWMVTGVTWSPDHTDITNHYIRLGTIGGLPLMILFIAILLKGFFYIGDLIQSAKSQNENAEFFIWAIGASLFAHAASCIAVSYFDQSFIFLYLVLGSISSVWSVSKIIESNQETDSGSEILKSND